MDDEITLGVLDAVHENASLTQRTLSKELGIALGLTNAYLKRCVRKGLIKVNSVPANRYAYYLTPKGFAEKSRLTAEYLSISFRFYGHARESIEECMAHCVNRGWRRVALAGTGELAEIALLVAMRHPVEVVGVADGAFTSGDFMGLPVAPAVDDFETVDAALVTDLKQPQKTYETLCARFSGERVLTPAVLKVSRKMALQSFPQSDKEA
jgi:DNA-binding MarR family transcriptional regulator